MLKQQVSCSATSEETPVPLASTSVSLPVSLPSYVTSSVTVLQQAPLPTYASVLFQAPLRNQDPEAPEERSARGECSPDQGGQLLNGALEIKGESNPGAVTVGGNLDPPASPEEANCYVSFVLSSSCSHNSAPPTAGHEGGNDTRINEITKLYTIIDQVIDKSAT